MKPRVSRQSAFTPDTAGARAHQRRQCHAFCKIGSFRSTLVGSVLDASAAGVKCSVPNGLVPSVGDTVCLEWPDTSANFAIVAWIHGTRIGLRFTELEPNYLDKMDTANLGFENYCRTIANQIALTGRDAR